MKQPAIKIFGLWLGILAGNLVYQAFDGQMWEIAIERSWFQLMALLPVYVFIRVYESEN